MKTLYFECKMGAAGDMMMAAMLELHGNPADFLDRLNKAGIPGVVVTAEASVKCGITGTRVKVEINGQEEGCAADRHTHDEHEHTSHGHDAHTHREHEYEHKRNSYNNIEHLIGHLNVSNAVKKNALEVYKLIAEAESHTHGVPVNQIHFHEMGEMDAVADIVSVCMLIEELGPELILASPVNVGGGHVRCAHGILPVPAPATAYILQNVPIYSDNINSELCTPTGAALLKHFVKEFCRLPLITVTNHGYGMGKKDFERANCVRAYLGDTHSVREEITELVCNLDDMTPEEVAFAQQLLFEEGALDVYTTTIGMKKGRIGLSFTCMCRTSDKDKMLALIFKHTTTLGIREYISGRYTLKKEQTEIQTKFGTVKVKTSRGFGVEKSKPEYEDIAKIAREQGMSIQDVVKMIKNKIVDSKDES